MKKSVYTDSSCSQLRYANISKIHCTQKCSTFGGYPYYNGSSYRLQVYVYLFNYMFVCLPVFSRSEAKR